MTVKFVPCRLPHVHHVGKRLREADKREAHASTGVSPEEALLDSYWGSWIADTILVDEEPVGIFGCAPLDTSGRWGLWMLGTDLMKKHSKALMRPSRFILGALFRQSEARCFENFTHDENKVHHRWLKAMGANLGEPIPYGTKGELFRPFIILRETYV